MQPYLRLDGFQYKYFQNPNGISGGAGLRQDKDIADARISWLLSQSSNEIRERFNPQPWRQASLALQEMGYDRAAQKVSIRRRIQERYSRDTPFGERIVNKALHLVAEYGHNPWRAIFLSLALIVAFSLVYHLSVVLCGDLKYLAPSSTCDAPMYIPVRYGDVEGSRYVTDYPDFSPFFYSLGSFVPLFDLGSESFWRANTATPWGWILYVLFVLERVLGAIFIAIAVTAFTGMLTRDER
ncbi:hypothetical protein [Limimaricola soesokkakensis]|uniref:hypothetical protein n=1 Tax=Limimaricola soesokkakensis TaxID=1343159 RepID=UPI001055BA4A|nr:hypothetical protein [Limimaricola soesokkakensis]